MKYNQLRPTEILNTSLDFVIYELNTVKGEIAIGISNWCIQYWVFCADYCYDSSVNVGLFWSLGTSYVGRCTILLVLEILTIAMYKLKKLHKNFILIIHTIQIESWKHYLL